MIFTILHVKIQHFQNLYKYFLFYKCLVHLATSWTELHFRWFIEY